MQLSGTLYHVSILSVLLVKMIQIYWRSNSALKINKINDVIV